ADQPEHGGSMQIKPFSMALAANKAAELIRGQAHGGKAIVIGLSEGAQVAVQMLATCPEVIEKAVISSALLLPMSGAKMFSSRGLISALFKMSVSPFRNSDWWIKLNMKYAAGIPDEFYPQFKADFQKMTESQFVNLMVANQTFRMPEGIEKANVPALIVYGSHEYKAMKDSARTLASKLSGSHVFQISLGKGSSLASEHNWAMTAPQAFVDTIRNWLSGQPLPEELSGLV
ncbi:MAG: alpha/beta hydrolase, partial [Anaerolineaceae bacterium]|nr:alpha/beta hydrolase [Anaerolineaceae bacterium]